MKYRYNPFNIRFSTRNSWQGQFPMPVKGFCEFESAYYGYRAFWVIMRNYFNKHKCRCVYDVISRFAPKSENDTDHYIDFCCKRVYRDTIFPAVSAFEKLKPVQWFNLGRAMALFESKTLISFDDNDFNKSFKEEFLTKCFPHEKRYFDKDS